MIIYNDFYLYLKRIASQIYPAAMHLNKANTPNTEAPFLELNLSILDGFVSSHIFEKHDNFDFNIVRFPLSDGDFPATLVMVYTSVNLFALLWCLVIWLVSMLVIRVLNGNPFTTQVSVSNFGKNIVDTLN